MSLAAHLDAIEDERNYDSDYDSDDSHEREYDDEEDEDVEDDSSDASGDNEQTPEGSSNLTPEQLKAQLDDLARRYAGQTRKVGELMQERQARDNAYFQERRALLEALLHERVQDLPVEEQRSKFAQLNAYLETEQKEAHLTQREQLVGQGLREQVLHNMAAQYEVDVNELRNFRDITDAEFFAARESQRKKQETQTKKRTRRRTQGKDTFDERRTTSAPPKAPTNLEEAENAFLREARRIR